MLDLIAGAREVELEQVVVALELEPAQRPLRLGRARHEGNEPVPAAALVAADEEDPALRQGGPLPAEVRLQLGRERRAVHGVVRPEPAVLDQDPRVDPTCRRAERLGVRERDLGAERGADGAVAFRPLSRRLARSDRHLPRESTQHHSTSPLETASPTAIETPPTTPER